MNIYTKLNEEYYSTERYINNLERSNSTQKNINILKNIKLEKTYNIADFGCGIGALFDSLESRIDKYYGVDFSKVLIDHGRNRHSRLLNDKVFLYDQEITEFCRSFENRFDIAFALDFMEHLYDDDVVKIFEAIGTTLKATGKLVIHTPNGDFFLEMMKTRKIIQQLPSHIAVRNFVEIEKLLNKAGYKKLTCRILPHWNVLKNIHFLSYMPIAGKFFEARLLIECRK